MYMSEINDIKEIIKGRRLELNLTQLDVAKVVGVSEGTVSRWESGDIGDMKRSRIAALARALQLSPNVIMGWKEEEDFQLGNLLSTDDEDLILIVKKIVNMPKEKFDNIKEIINDTISFDDNQRDQLEKFIKIIKSNILN